MDRGEKVSLDHTQYLASLYFSFPRNGVNRGGVVGGVGGVVGRGVDWGGWVPAPIL